MVDPFTTVIQRLDQLGFFTFLLPYMLTSAIFYGLLRKSQIFGEPEKNVVVNATVSLVAAFMILAYPIIQGVDLKAQFSAFFAQSVIAILGVMVSIMIAGMVFPPDLPKLLNEKFHGGGFWSLIVAGSLIVGIALLFSSGLSSVFFPASSFSAIPQDTLLTIGVLVVLVITAVLFVYIAGVSGGGKGD